MITSESRMPTLEMSLPPETPMTNLRTIVRMLPEAAKNLAADPVVEGDDDLLSHLAFVADLIQRAPQPLPSPGLVYVERNRQVVAVPIKERLRIGRSPECELSFPDMREISRFHSEIVIEKEVAILRDTNSRNGTKIRGGSTAVVQHELRDGDVILIGGLKFVFLNGGNC